MKITLLQKLNKALLLSASLLIFSCSQPENKSETKQNDTSKVQEVTEQEANLPPKPEKFTWFYSMCTYTGTFDANKYSKKQLENALKYLIIGEGTIGSFSIFTPADLERVNKTEVENEFNETLKSLNTLEFPKNTMFDEIKQKRIKEVKRLKLLSLMQLESYSNPKVLNNDNYSKENCTRYTKALIEGGDALLKMRKIMAEESRDDGNTSAWEQYTEENSSENKLQLARIFVTGLGWWNCVNNSIERVDGDAFHKSVFLKCFSNVTEECEEP